MKKLEIKNIYKIFGPNPRDALKLAQAGCGTEEILERTGSLVAVNDASFAVGEGEIFVVMGLSGSGKSTLIRCINRLFEPTSGQVLLDGEDVTAISAEQLREVRLNRIAMVFQHFALLPHKTVVENASFGLKMRGMAPPERRKEAVHALETVGLGAWADSLPEQLSGGMQQRVGLARALAMHPELLLMDEPFSALDPLIRRDMQGELIDIQRRLGTTIVFITHDLQEALRVGDQVAIMKNGTIVQIGTPEEIVLHPAGAYVAEFTEDVDRARVLRFASLMEESNGIPGDATVAEAAARLGEPAAAMAFVVDEAGRPIGYVDRAVLATADTALPVHQIVRRDYVRVRESERIFEAFGRLETADVVAVVDAEGRLRGLTAARHIFRYLGDQTRNGADESSDPARSDQHEEQDA